VTENNDLARLLLEHAKSIAPDAVVVVFVDDAGKTGEEPPGLATNGTCWDIAEAIHDLADWLAVAVDHAEDERRAKG
jgi:hypothetical protein